MSMAVAPMISGPGDQQRAGAGAQGAWIDNQICRYERRTHGRNRKQMTNGDWDRGQPHQAAILPVEAEGNCEEPTHAWIEAMKGPEASERQPRPKLGGCPVHRCAWSDSPGLRVYAGTRRLTSRIAVGVGRAVAALEPHLVRAMRCRPSHKELGIEGYAAIRIGVELHHPAVNAVGIELRIDGAIERV